MKLSEGVNATVLTLEPERIFCEQGEPIVCTRMTLHIQNALMAWGRGTDITIYPGHEERLTREEWAEKQAVAIAAAARAHDAYYWEVWVTTGCGDTPPEERYVAGVRACGGKLDPIAYGPDPFAALEALASAAKPCPHEGAEMNKVGNWTWASGNLIHCYRPGDPCPDCGEPLPPFPLKDPDTMSAEECEAELEAAEARWICFRNYNMWQCPVVVGDERLDQIDVDWRTKERALRAAVRALREHQAAQSRT